MGVYHSFNVICSNCDFRHEANLVNAVNVSRFPELKNKVLKRELNRTRCPSCGHLSYVEKPFFYTDIKTDLNITVYPRKERHFHERASAETNRLFSAFDGTKVADIKVKRVVFGLEELREKIVAHDAGISDEVLELLKLYVLKEHPFLLDKKKVRVTLNQINQEKLEFNATSDQERDYFTVYVPRAFYEALLQPQDGAGQVHPKKLAERTFGNGKGASWVNLWKINPQNDALKVLSSVAEAIRAKKNVDFEAPEFVKMLKTLPPGSQLPAWAKADLKTLADHAQDIGEPDVVERLFKIRFGFGIEDDWFKNSDDKDIGVIWTLLKDLPDVAVEGSTWIRAIYLDEEEDGGGSYDPSTKEIHIGSGLQSGDSAFRNVILHEVGHSVQEKFDQEKSGLVTQWLLSEFGWQVIAPDTKGIDAWIGLMGGYPAGTSTQVKNQVRSYIQQSLGPGGTFKQAPIVKGPAEHLRNNRTFGPRKAFELTKGYWWNTCDEFYAHGTKSFFVNYYYGQLMVVNKATIDLVAKFMPDRYAAMSHFEFFAELFAWFYDSQSPKRDKIPQKASGWLIANVGTLDLSAPFGPRRPPPPDPTEGRSRSKKAPKR